MSTSGSADEVIELVVGDEAGERLDTWLAARLDVSRSRAAQLIEQGRVTLNGAVPKKRDRPARGDRVEVRIPPPEPSHLAPEAIPLTIVHQDDDLLVIDKPPGLVVHPAPGNPTGTLVNALLHAVGDLSGIGGVLRPGIVHRLDKDTSGLMVVAKHDDAHRALSAELRARRIRRAYLAAAWGHLPKDEVGVDAPIGRHPTER
ncbi:MAG TPA: RluA family pseudouridine synthase, partial [Longimicrobium sp.]|nr:RluA family pseudouridine synthase [Longimicrobium sp.]